MSGGRPGGVLITGGAGLLGTALVRTAPPDTHLEVTMRTHRPTTDLTAHHVELASPDAFDAVVASVAPRLVIHTAYAKEDLERDVVEATRAVADACAAHGVELIHCSSDVVFDGEDGPYDESRPPTPITAYGEAKARAETIVAERCAGAAVVRTTLLVQAEPPDSVSAWAIEANRRGEAVTWFTDEFRCPVSVDDVADGIWRIAALAGADRGGMWHLVGPERLSRAELGDRLATRFGLDRTLFIAAPSASVAGPRPRDVALTCARAEAAIGWAPRTVAAALDRDAGGPQHHR